MKNILILVAVVAAVAAVWFFIGRSETELVDNGMTGDSAMTEMDEQDNGDADRQTVAPGTYEVNAAASQFNWAGKKPLIDGYINSGAITVTKGEITVGEDTATGSFELDMNTLTVGLTAKKPGSETTLEGHLKGERWFDVAAYPTAEFVITGVEATADSETSFEYQVTGDLTLKGVTNEITFPATIYQTEDGAVYAEAVTEIDRTKWGLTFGSGNFFDSLGDNVIDDMVLISFKVVAE